jgi:opacity protein-like surface antigen
MKRIIVGVVTAMLLIGAASVVRAEEGIEVEVGVKAWFNKWKRELPTGESSKSKCTRLLGPAVEVKFPDHIFVEASYLASLNDYRFSDITGQTKFERKDLDMAMGYAITPMVSVFAGYKESAFKEDVTGNKETNYGPIAGIRGSYALNDKTSFHGGLNYLLTRLKVEDAAGTVTEKSPGWIAELGAQYEFAKHTSVDLGYKYETTKGKESKIKDTFAGLTLGVKYAF